MSESLPAARRSGRSSSAPPGQGRQRLLTAAEQLLATRGLEVPSRVIVAAAGQHNQSAINYHFGSRAGLIAAIRARHEAPITQHRRQLMLRLPEPEQRTTRQLVEAHIQPLTAEMLRCAPSYWARFSEMLLLGQPLDITRNASVPAHSAPGQPARPVLGQLLDLTAAHLTHLPAHEAIDRVALTFRFLISSLARWEHDSEAGLDSAGQLAPFTLTLTDLAVTMLQAPSSVLSQTTG